MYGPIGCLIALKSDNLAFYRILMEIVGGGHSFSTVNFYEFAIIFLIGLSKNVGVIAAAVLMCRNPWRFVSVNVGGEMPKIYK